MYVHCELATTARAGHTVQVLDGEHERRTGTAECKLRSLRTPHHAVTLIDLPGAAQHVDATVSGIAAAQAVLLVVDSAVGACERSLAKGGQAREHALLAYMLGVRSVVVAVTKLDAGAAPYSQLRFEECVAVAAHCLKLVGYADRTVCVPCAGLIGDNVRTSSAAMPWCAAPNKPTCLRSEPRRSA